MPRYRVTLEYHGGPFAGWQRQDNGPSVQGALEAAVFKLCGETVTVTGAGRTDAGVHALGQVAHFDLVKEFAPDKVRVEVDEMEPKEQTKKATLRIDDKGRLATSAP